MVYSVYLFVNKSMQLRKTLTHSGGQTLKENNVYRLMLNLVIHGIQCVLICKQINAVKKYFKS